MGGSPTDKRFLVEAQLLQSIQEMGITWELSFVSAHRNPEALLNYVQRKVNIGTKLLLAYATLAAALGGAVAAASKARIPTLGVPIPADDGFSGGHDALYAMLRMPPGIPVLVPGVGIIGLKLAAIAAGQILGLTNPEIKGALVAYLEKNHKEPQFKVTDSTNFNPDDYKKPKEEKKS